MNRGAKTKEQRPENHSTVECEKKVQEKEEKETDGEVGR